MALCGLASATLAAGDDVGARAVIEEALVFCTAAGYVGLDCLYGALALLFVKANDRERARRVFGMVREGAEHATGFRESIADPSGALRKATSEARVLLGNPPADTVAAMDIEAILRAD